MDRRFWRKTSCLSLCHHYSMFWYKEWKRSQVFYLLRLQDLSSGVVVITTAQFHSTKLELTFCTSSDPPRGVLEIPPRWWGSLTIVPTRNKAKRISLVNHTTKTIHHHYQTVTLRGDIICGRIFFTAYLCGIYLWR